MKIVELPGPKEKAAILVAQDSDGIKLQDEDQNTILTADATGVTIAVDLTVEGATTTVQSTTLQVTDKNVELAVPTTGSPSDAAATGAGITIKATADKTLQWEQSTDAFHSSVGVRVAGSLGVNCTTPERKLDVEDASDVPQARLTYTDQSVYTDLFTTSNGTFRVTPTARTMQVDTGDANGGNVQFTKSGGVVSGGVSWDTGDKDVTIYSEADLMLGAGGSSAKVFIDNGGDVGIGLSTPKTKLTVEGAITLKEQAAADADTADYGQVWCKSGVTPNQLYFTTDAGDDIQLTSGTSIAGSGGGDVSAGSTFTTANIIMVCDGDDKTIDEPSATISTNDQALTVGNNTGIRVGDGSELELSVEVGNDVVIRSHASNADVHFKVNDGGTNTTVMVLDGGDPAVHIKGGAVSSGILKIFEDSDDGTDAVSITVPALGSAYTITLPDGAGDDGQFLKTNGSGVTSWAAASGTDRMTVTNRFRCGALSATASTYFTGDVATDAGQFYIGSWSKTHGSTIDVDSDWLAGFEVGPQWQAPRACTLTQICATSRINNTAATAVRVHVFKATPVNNNPSTTQIEMTLVASADLDDGGGSPGVLTDYELQTVNDAISSGNSVSANDCIIIGLQPITGATAATSYFQITLEFTVT